jgi:tRNA(Arg) A34 adenosine deaminase TadA
MTDEQYMDLALVEAEAALARGDLPVGAVLVKDGAVVAKGANRQVSERDLTWHAEMEIVRNASRTLGTTDLSGTVMYCTMECCPMCAWAVKIAGVKRMVLGLRHADIQRTDLGTYSMESFSALVGGGVELQTGVRNAECLALRRRWGRDPVRR